MNYYIVKYSGQFGFIKPWTAVRDSETFSQQFLTPSIVAGMERKLFPELLHEPWGIYKILRHRLSYQQMSAQTETVQSRGWNSMKNGKIRKTSIMSRSVLLNPSLFLAFENEADAQHAATQHLCLCRNEDIIYPIEEVFQVSQEEFDNDLEQFAGYELIFEETDEAFLVGYNRYNEGKPMHGWLKVLGNPVKSF